MIRGLRRRLEKLEGRGPSSAVVGAALTRYLDDGELPEQDEPLRELVLHLVAMAEAMDRTIPSCPTPDLAPAGEALE